MPHPDVRDEKIYTTFLHCQIPVGCLRACVYVQGIELLMQMHSGMIMKTASQLQPRK